MNIANINVAIILVVEHNHIDDKIKATTSKSKADQARQIVFFIKNTPLFI
jgi:ABC-type uncharacterized transport system substrate-binding protein